METLVKYSLVLWFFFFLMNYAEITARPVEWLKQVLGPKVGYPLKCAMCFAFWITLSLWVIGVAPLWYVFAAPVTHLFIDLAYSKLSEPLP